MKILGVNTLSHDSSICLLNKDGTYKHLICKNRNSFLDDEIIREAIAFKPDVISYYEKPWLKKKRQLFNGQWINALTEETPASYFKRIGLGGIPIKYQSHHVSHAATGYYTSQFDSAAVLVVDAIGEYTTTSAWHVKDNKFKLLGSADYPLSVGLFYSAFTKLLGFKPNAEEHELYALSELADNNRHIYIEEEKCYDKFYLRVKDYLEKDLHRGITDWYEVINEKEKVQIAHAVQCVFEEKMEELCKRTKMLCGYPYEENLVIVGGCAANKKAARHAYRWFNNVHIPLKPGDVSSSIGAAMLVKNAKI